MKKILLSIVFLLSSISAQAWTQRPNFAQAQCISQAPYGFPQTQPIQPICRQGYFVGYDAAAKLPKYVTYTLLPQNVLGCVARTNAFTADQTIVNGATPQDYVGTAYDKGHMSPDGDQSWDTQVEYESFLMTNMSPQAGSLNRGIWKLLETSVRGWAYQRNQPYTIYVGSLYNATDKKIGKGVVVPHGFYKIVINNVTKEYAAWSFPHTEPYPNLGNDLTKFRVGLAQLEGQAGVIFALPQGAKELAPGQEWTVDFGALTQAKRAKCGNNASDD